jgi:hypothetical protein
MEACGFSEKDFMHMELLSCYSALVFFSAVTFLHKDLVVDAARSEVKSKIKLGHKFFLCNLRHEDFLQVFEELKSSKPFT